MPKIFIKKYCLIFIIHLFSTMLFAQSSVLSSSTWFKVSVEKQGVYKMDYSFLKNLGVDIDNIDPRKIHLYGNGGKVLPQQNNASPPSDLTDIPIKIVGESDGKFDPSDYLLFYATNIDSTYFDDRHQLVYKQHPYETKAYYYLSIKVTDGLRIASEPNQGNAFTKVTSYDYYDVFEKDIKSMLGSGREWYGDFYGSSNTTKEYNFGISHIQSGEYIKVTTSTMAQSYSTSSFEVSLNGSLLGSQTIPSITTYQYGIQGRKSVKTFTTTSSDISQWKVNIRYNGIDKKLAEGYLDYIIFQAKRKLTIDKQFNFRVLASINQPLTTYEVQGATNNTQVWDVTHHLSPKNQNVSISGSTASFGAPSMTLREYVVFDNSNTLSPKAIGNIDRQNLRGKSPPEVLIITHPDFLSSAERLASFRRQQSGFKVLVATTTQVFNEFSSGSNDPTAIRDIAKYYYDKGILKHLLLFGKCSYDLRGISKDNTNFVPTYPSRNSLHPLETYSSDDYFGFLENDEGEWIETPAGDHTLDIGVGRLPVSTQQEADNIVTKIIRYETNPQCMGNWRKRILFVADDGELFYNLHHKQADELTVFCEANHPTFNTEKVFLDNYEQQSNTLGKVAPEVSNVLNKKIDRGVLIVNYTGHGGVLQWTQENILDVSMIDSWNNQYRMPLFVTATCDFGRHDDPTRKSGGEHLLLNPNGGGIGIVTTGRPVSSGTNFLLNQAFYNNVFKQVNGKYLTLGDVFKNTKNESLNGSSNRNFSLLGDPSMTLAYPAKEVIIDKISSSTGKLDTLAALAKVHIEGHIKNSHSFDGQVQVTVFDKQNKRQTKGDENPIYKYKEWGSIIFQGYSSVNKGSFSTEFIVPKNIDYRLGKGKISIYAVDKDKKNDGNGANIEVVLGGSAPFNTGDRNPPEISLSINDSTHTDQVFGGDILLIAQLSDESAINISNQGIGGGLFLSLDDSTRFDVSEYYHANKDTYKEGWLLFPINGLATGTHELRLSASDVYGNSTVKSIKFEVNKSKLFITKLYNYPNPTNGNTTFVFEHNFPGDNLDITLEMYRPTGDLFFQQSRKKIDANRKVVIGSIDTKNINGYNLEAGIYIYGIKVRSSATGIKTQKFQKLIVTN